MWLHDAEESDARLSLPLARFMGPRHYLHGGGAARPRHRAPQFGARWYDPTTGTWTPQDTRNTPLDPHIANRYGYAADDPTNNADPLGKCSFWEDPGGCIDERQIGTSLPLSSRGLVRY
jgi:RHS repeat-associated protein